MTPCARNGSRVKTTKSADLYPVRGWVTAVTILVVAAGFFSACSFLFPEHLEPPWGGSPAPNNLNDTLGYPDSGFHDIPADSEQVLFEIAYFNAAWGLQQKGTYIDAAGNIYKYDKHRLWEHRRDHQYTHKQLMEKFNQKEPFGSVNMKELMEMRELIKGAAQESLVEYSCCRDAGTLTYLGYIYLGHGEYQAVPLYQSGDTSGENPSEAAMTLSQWLYSTNGGKGNLYLDDKFCHCLKDY